MTGTTPNGHRGRIVVLSGRSGSGKTTVCNRLVADPGVVLSVSATTRSPRAGEQDGVHYHFLSRNEFERRVKEGGFAEHAEYNGELYGTPKDALDKQLALGRTVLLEIDVQGAEQMRRVYPDATYIFLDAPDRAAAAERLSRRNTETPDQVRRRLEAGDAELRRAGLFDHRVVNDDLDDTVETIRRLIAKSRPTGTDSSTLDGGCSG